MASAAHEAKGSDDGVLVVGWDGPDDPANPRNWTKKKKWAASFVNSGFRFISPVSSSMVAPAAAQIVEQFHITSSAEASLTISVFVLAYAVGPLVLGPLSEMFAWNLGCGSAQNSGQLIAFRFLAGLGGSAPLATGGAALSDMWAPEKPHAPKLLQQKANRIRKVIETDPEKGPIQEIRTTHPLAAKSVVATPVYHCVTCRLRSSVVLWKKALVRPFGMFATEPIVQLFGVYMMFIYGTIYLVLTTIPAIFNDVYYERVGIAGLHYIGLGVGLVVATQLNARALDRVYKHLKARNGGVGQPEFRSITVFPGTILIPAVLLMAGWGIHTHWIVVDIGVALVGAGMILTFQGMRTYIIDAFTAHAASALAAVSFLRSIAGFCFPLFAPAMYKALGYVVGDTILAAFAAAIGPPAVLTFWKFGAKIRGMSPHARRSRAQLANK
ncbi:hypothetical protein FOMPIDRAFT_1029755 [Fomitopsis schrenkii]|uniref:Major facilitator superfamily (MFS) profile domain-containing protein n=1 Tax=Fomitopsis schrenkii TaxID=2126942 RepID=S8FJD4_FOMSC|nr:hypothetical protein FOMPIDRAFT_1029755 [Fomitopsis schrenkii]